MVNIREQKLVKTFTNVEAFKLVSVRNKRFSHLASDFSKHWMENGDGLNSSKDSDDALSIVALAVSCIALVAVLANFYLSRSQKEASSNESLAGKKSEIPPSVA